MKTKKERMLDAEFNKAVSDFYDAISASFDANDRDDKYFYYEMAKVAFAYVQECGQRRENLRKLKKAPLHVKFKRAMKVFTIRNI